LRFNRVEPKVLSAIQSKYHPIVGKACFQAKGLALCVFSRYAVFLSRNNAVVVEGVSGKYVKEVIGIAYERC